jgi:general secretion pathway protein E
MDALATAPTIVSKARRLPPATAREHTLSELRAAGVPEAKIHALRDSSASTPVQLARDAFRDKLIDEACFHTLLAQVLQTAVHGSIDTADVCEQFVRRLPIAFVRRWRLLGLRPRDGYMPLVTDDPQDFAVADAVGRLLATPIRVELTPAAVLQAAINAAYSAQSSDFAGVLGETQPVAQEPEVIVEGDLLDTASRAPVIKLVNMLLFEAVKRLASDVHVQPFESHVQARFRIDGVLYDYLEIPKALLDEVISRIKVIGRMDIAEKRIAQDGRTTVTVGERAIDLRISIIPTSYGERAVLRLLDKSARLYELDELGMSARDRERFEQIIQKTHGIVLVTGPTGSGKSTTLYAALQYLDCKECNILTLEDPIEYQLPGISQMQVSTKKGMTFATGLRAVLRQDPDVIMVGEIRDEETARMAVQSSLTGHLVFSTLHTNNAAGAVSRLLDLGIEPYLVASSLLASVAQRLIRIVCNECGVKTVLSAEAVSRLGVDRSLEGAPIVEPKGCDACAGTGYRGRKGIFEMLVVDEKIRELIVSKAKTSEIERAAVAGAMATLRKDAIRKLLEGQTTLEEVVRVTHEDVAE